MANSILQMIFVIYKIPLSTRFRPPPFFFNYDYLGMTTYEIPLRAKSGITHLNTCCHDLPVGFIPVLSD